jgi:predicted GIY-YIG superfamily endonuclease
VSWRVYVLYSERLERTYVGITTDLDRRLAQHNGEKTGGARATRAGRPWTVAARYGPYETRSEATQVEWRVKKLRGKQRLQFEG